MATAPSKIPSPAPQFDEIAQWKHTQELELIHHQQTFSCLQTTLKKIEEIIQETKNKIATNNKLWDKVVTAEHTFYDKYTTSSLHNAEENPQGVMNTLQQAVNKYDQAYTVAKLTRTDIEALDRQLNSHLKVLMATQSKTQQQVLDTQKNIQSVQTMISTFECFLAKNKHKVQ
jgi:predicted  nucleic acid-binding Zn-ribbon protein